MERMFVDTEPMGEAGERGGGGGMGGERERERASRGPSFLQWACHTQYLA